MSDALAEIERFLQHGDALCTLLEQYRPRVIVELGTWRGASAIAMAYRAREWNGVIYCVDTWTGRTDGATVVGGLPLQIFETAANMVMRGVAAQMRLIPASTQAAAKHWEGAIDCLYVDASHAEESVIADLAAWLPHVRSGGLVVGDDYGDPRFPGVQMAWESAAYLEGFTLAHVPETRLVYGIKP